MNLLTGDIVEKFYTFLWPLTRIAAALMTVPILSVDAANARVRLMLALALTLLIFPMFTWPIIDPISSLGITTMFNQVGIGVMMGLTLQVITAAMIVAGQAISSAMGLSMSNLLDPNLGNVPVLSQFLIILSTLIFLGTGGHLMLISILLDSFTLIPVGQSLLSLAAIGKLLAWSSMMFLGAVLIGLPVLVTLLVVNIGLGVMTRAAPSLNIFVVGLPATILAGFMILLLSMGSIGSRIQWLWLQGFAHVRDVLGIS
jgi:flagellar biosynthetic protein FliR